MTGIALEPQATTGPASGGGKRSLRRSIGLGAGFAVAVVSLLVSVVTASMVGTADISPLEVVSTILRHTGLSAIAPTEPLPPLLDALVWQSRVPRVLLAGVVGP